MKAIGAARRFRVEAVVEPGRAGNWGSSQVTIFDGDTRIGEYKRNHPGFAEQTFEPFELGGAWYALYSRDYTSTRLMSLPDCTDLGGEEPAPNGFCPVELYVPRYKSGVVRNKTIGRETEHWWFETTAEDIAARGKNDQRHDYISGPWLSLTTGFVAGCLWGDDTSWKLEVLDLSNAPDGKISRSPRFGHVQLARGMSLSDALVFDSHMPHWELRATVIRQERRDVSTGALIDPYDE